MVLRAGLQITAIVGLIIFGVCISAGAAPNGEGAIGFRCECSRIPADVGDLADPACALSLDWHNPGAFQQYTKGDLVVGGAWGRFLAFWTVLIQAAFSFIGTEIVAVAVGESENPRRTVPKAIKSVFFRIVLFYVLSMFVIGTCSHSLLPSHKQLTDIGFLTRPSPGMLVSADDPRLLRGDSTASTSPFVIASESTSVPCKLSKFLALMCGSLAFSQVVNAGIKGLPSVVNAVLLVSAWSSGNSVLYAASRVLYSLALEGKAPKIFRRCTKGGLPVYCVAVTGVIGFLAFMSCGNTTAATAFNWLQNLSSLSGLITWALILTSYLRFYYGMKTQNRSRDDLPYKAPFQPYFSWFGLVAVIIVILFNGASPFRRTRHEECEADFSLLVLPSGFGVFVARPFEASNFVAAYSKSSIAHSCRCALFTDAFLHLLPSASRHPHLCRLLRLVQVRRRRQARQDGLVRLGPYAARVARGDGLRLGLSGVGGDGR